MNPASTASRGSHEADADWIYAMVRVATGVIPANVSLRWLRRTIAGLNRTFDPRFHFAFALTILIWTAQLPAAKRVRETGSQKRPSFRERQLLV
jgi:hypothetical protein